MGLKVAVQLRYLDRFVRRSGVGKDQYEAKVCRALRRAGAAESDNHRVRFLPQEAAVRGVGNTAEPSSEYAHGCECVDHWVEGVDGAMGYTLIASYTFGNGRVVAALVRAAKRGVPINLMADAPQHYDRMQKKHRSGSPPLPSWSETNHARPIRQISEAPFSIVKVIWGVRLTRLWEPDVTELTARKTEDHTRRRIALWGMIV